MQWVQAESRRAGRHHQLAGGAWSRGGTCQFGVSLGCCRFRVSGARFRVALDGLRIRTGSASINDYCAETIALKPPLLTRKRLRICMCHVLYELCQRFL